MMKCEVFLILFGNKGIENRKFGMWERDLVLFEEKRVDKVLRWFWLLCYL